MVRIVTTGGGGWGDPLAREVDKVVYDVQCGLVSPQTRRATHYGVVLRRSGGRTGRRTSTRRATLREERCARRGTPLPMFDRGPYFAKLKAEGKVQLSGGLARSGRGLAWRSRQG